MKRFFLGVLLTALLGGCSTSSVFSSKTPQQLIGQASYWEIRRVWDKATLVDVPITLTFDGIDKISGFSGCNQFAAIYSITSRRIKISSISATTAHVCSADIMAQEKRLFDVLSMVHWVRPETNGDILFRMLHENGDPVRLSPASGTMRVSCN